MTGADDETVAMPNPDGGGEPAGGPHEPPGGPPSGPPEGDDWYRTPGGMAAIGVAVVVVVVLLGLLFTRGDDGGETDTSASGDTSSTDEDGSSAGGDSNADGSSGSSDADEIREWQAALNAVGCDAGAEDGVLGTATFDALSHFQNATGLPSDGAFTPESIDALLAAADTGDTVCTPDNAPSDGGSSGTGSSGTETPGTGAGGGVADAIFEIARGQYVSAASGCPTEGGLPDIDPSAVSTDVSNLDALQSDAEVVILEGVTTGPAFGAQAWTYDADNDIWNWSGDFCAGYTGG